PAVFPYLVTGWVTAAGGAWNASIVSEAGGFRGQTLATGGRGAGSTAPRGRRGCRGVRRGGVPSRGVAALLRPGERALLAGEMSGAGAMVDASGPLCEARGVSHDFA